MAPSAYPSPPLRIRLERIANVTYRHADAAAACRFAVDFGFVECGRSGPRTFFRGYGTEPWVLCVEQAEQAGFGGVAFAVASVAELERARELLAPHVRTTEVYDLAAPTARAGAGAPGGGRGFTFWDPVGEGVEFHLVAGQQAVEMLDQGFPELKFNYPTKKNRGPNQFQRFEKRPAAVHKLGHYGLCVTDFNKYLDFFTTFFNFYPSDLVHDDEGVDKTVFFRLDKGAELVDHHCFFFFEGPKPHVHHSSFETHDFDAQVLGHDWLRDKGWKPCWGIGRHVMGSQIFDYWFDPSDFIVEHYADGDLLDVNEPTHRVKASPNNLHVWGPEVPASFLG